MANLTYTEELNGSNILTQYVFDDGFIGNEHSYTMKWDKITGVSTQTFTSTLNPIEYIKTISLTATETKYRNGTAKYQDSTHILYTHQSGVIEEYNLSGIKLGETVGTDVYTWNNDEQTLSLTTSTDRQINYQDGTKLSYSLTQDMPGTYYDFDDKRQLHTDYLISSVYYDTEDTKWKV